MSIFNRRSFLGSLGALSSSAAFSRFNLPRSENKLREAIASTSHLTADELSSDEDFWSYVQQEYTTSPAIINLNNGGVAPSPLVVQEAMKKYHDFSVEAPSYNMWRILDQGREPLRRELSRVAGCDPEELALVRNASEALETVIFGLQLKRGDEVVLSKQDYPNMINAWKQREMREGIKLVWVNHQLPSEDMDQLVSAYTNVFSPRTKVVQVTHIINWNGQIMPVNKIAQAAHQRGIEVLVDGAHSFAQFEFKIAELNCDYFGTSLHKWLSASIGTGFLFVKKSKISSLFPLFASAEPTSSDIRKFENLGTRPFYIEQSVGKAIEFYEMIGAKRKEKRLHYLKNYWMNAVKDVPNIMLHTSLDPKFGCAIGMVSIREKPAQLLEQFLFSKYKVHTVAVDWENIHGVRITPNVYTSTRNLDVLIEGINAFVRSGF